MKFGSLFSGIGGFDLGFEQAGMAAAWQCEIDKQAQEVLRRRFNVEVYDDVRTIGKDAGAVDLICGGFPCQDLSIAGKRAGLAGKRSGLWFEFHRILAELTPRWVVIENVPGLLSSNGGRDFAVILRGLGELGYLPAWRILDAQYFGVPQRRRRVFIVASLGSGRAAEVLFEREGMSGDTPPSREAGKDVAYSLRSNPSHSGDKGDGGINTTMVAISGMGEYKEQPGTLRANGGDIGGGSEILVSYGLNSRNNRYDAESQTLVTAFTPRRTHFDGVENMSPTLNAGGGGFGSPAIAWTERTCKEGGGKGYLVAKDHTFPVGPQGQYVGVRRLTPTECARLQGFPDDWNAWLSDTVRYRQFGNAVAVPVAEWIGRRIMQAGD
jgi:DNA (cytosine-5)-methyltransferase 1